MGATDGSFHLSLFCWHFLSVSDYFCFSMGVTDGLFHFSLFLGLVFTFCFRVFCIQYEGGSSLALVQRTKFFLKYQGHILVAAEPIKLDLDLEDIPDPGEVQQVMLLWRKQSFCWKPVWSSPKWDLLPSSCSVCRLLSRTVESAVLPELRMLKAKGAAGLMFSEGDMSLDGSLSL